MRGPRPAIHLLSVIALCTGAMTSSSLHASAAATTGGRIVFVRDYTSLHTSTPDGADRLPVWRSPQGRHRGSIYRPAWEPNGRRIAFGFTRWWTGETTILTILEDGNRLRRVVKGKDPAWAPEGDRIAFARNGQIWTVHPDGSGEQQLTSLPDGTRVGTPAWSPDGTTIVFAVDADLWAIGATGSDPHLVLADAREPAFSPDGARLLSVTSTTSPVCEECECPGGDVIPTLQVSDPDGTDLSTLWIPAAHDGILRASFSPDGSGFAVEYRVQFGSSSCEDFFSSSVATVGIDGSAFVPLGPTGGTPPPSLTQPDWSWS